MKLLSSQNFIGVWDCAVPGTICESIITHHRRDKTKFPGTTGARICDITKKHSTDQTFVYPNAPDSHLEAIQLVKSCLREYLLLFPDADRQVHPFGLYSDFNVQHYKPTQAYFAYHAERTGKETAHRHLVFMIYLNTVTDGGGTAFPNQNIVLDAVAGRVVIWPSDWTHSHHGVVSPTQEKFIMTGWYSYV